MATATATSSPRFTRSVFATCVAPSVPGGVEPGVVTRQAGDDQRVGARQRRHPRTQQSNRPGAEHDDGVTRANRGVDAHRVVRNRMRLCQARDVEWQRVGDAVKASRRHAYETCHRAVDPVAEAFALRAQVVATAPAQQAIAADACRCLAHDPVAFADASTGVSEPRHRAAELVAEHHRHRDRPRLGIARLVHVRAADRYRPDLEQHIVVADVGNRNFSELDGERREGVLNDGRLCGHKRGPHSIGVVAVVSNRARCEVCDYRLPSPDSQGAFIRL